MILNDKKIKQLCESEDPMISPYSPVKSRENDQGVGAISHGSSSFGYDLKLSSKDIRIFRSSYDKIIDPKRFDPDILVCPRFFNDDKSGKWFHLDAHSYALGVSVERFSIPSDITVVCIGKSTYARSGIFINTTPLEADWRGYLTIEIANMTSSPCRIYVDEGIGQLLFFQGKPCEVGYDRSGIYQDQEECVVLPRVNSISTT